MLSNKRFLFCLALFLPVSDAIRFRRQTVEIREFGGQFGATFENEPNLLFTKVIRSRVFAIGWEFTVDYQIFNVGESPATNVLVEDPDFDTKGMFLVVKPKPTSTEETMDKEDHNNTILSSGDFTVEDLSSGENVSYSLTAVALASSFPPDEGGHYQFLPAKITYAKGDAMQVGWSSLSHENGVKFLTKLQADRRHAPKANPLTIFILLVLTAVLVPFVLWKAHMVKYDGLQELVNQAREERRQIRRAKLHYH